MDTAWPIALPIAQLATHTAESARNATLISVFLPTPASPAMWPTACPVTLLINARNATQGISSITRPTLASVLILH